MRTAVLQLFADPASRDVLSLATSPLLWFCAIGVFAIIMLQTLLYVKAARQVAPGISMPLAEVRRSFQAGAIASIGPSLAVVLVAISLLALFGTPTVLLRISLVGSVATETASAGIAANSMGAELGGPSYTQQVFGLIFLVISLSGGLWMLATLILTPILKRGSATLTKRNPAAMAIVPAAALLAAFSMLSVTESGKSTLHLAIVSVSALLMMFILWLARMLKAAWLKEWALGFSIIGALAAAYFLHTAFGAA